MYGIISIFFAAGPNLSCIVFTTDLVMCLCSSLSSLSGLQRLIILNIIISCSVMAGTLANSKHAFRRSVQPHTQRLAKVGLPEHDTGWSGALAYKLWHHTPSKERGWCRTYRLVRSLHCTNETVTLFLFYFSIVLMLETDNDMAANQVSVSCCVGICSARKRMTSPR